MKKPLKIFSLLLLLCLLCIPTLAAEDDIRGVWVSTVFNLDFPSESGLSAAQLKAEIDDIIVQTSEMELNAIFFQVRPCADSLYPSKLFPTSAYLTGTQGNKIDGDFDPLEYFVNEAHKKNIELHAWINPYRVTKLSKATKDEALDLLHESHPARKNPQNTIFHTDGNLYFDPGIPANRTLIIQGALEIAQSYDVDGIHMDDYFYPSTDFADSDSYKKYGTAYKSVDDFRRASVDILIKELYTSLKSQNEDLQFGISPFGIWANKDSHELGSDTVGGQSYFSHYADTRKWVKDEIIDYICPQLYWPIGGKEGEFNTILNWWNDTVSGTDVKLYVGLGAYRLTDAAPDSPWYGTSMLTRQIEKSLDQSDGLVLFRYKSLTENFVLRASLPSTLTGDAVLPSYKLDISRPSSNVSTSLSQFYITGTSDLDSGLSVNGQTLTRSPSGFFGFLADLSFGSNTFVFQNGDAEKSVAIYRTATSSTPFSCIPSLRGTSVIPFGAPLTVSCEVDATAKVSLYINGKLVPLKNQYDGTFSTNIRLPVGEYKNPIYFIEIGGVVKPVITDAVITILPEGRAISASVASELCDIYESPDTSLGADGFLRRGMTAQPDYITSGMAHIPDIGYVKLSDIDFSVSSPSKATELEGVEATQKSGIVTVDFAVGVPSAAVCEIKDDALLLRISQMGAPISFESDFFTSVTAEKQSASVLYTLSLPTDYTSKGVEVSSSDTGVRLTIYPRAQPQNALDGVKILLDAGHGGDAAGAIGANASAPEKQLNLSTAIMLKEQLEAKGATVEMTRTGDTDVSLSERMSQIYRKSPDIFLSLHSNSASDDTDMSSLSGILLYTRSTTSSKLATFLASPLSELSSCKIEVENRLYMCRATVCPSILIENEYISNPVGLEKLVERIYISRFCAAITDGLCKYFAAQ